MTSTDVVAPSTSSTVKAKRGLASFKNMFSSKKNLVDQTSSCADESSPLSSEPSVDKSSPSPPTSSPSSRPPSSSSLLTPTSLKSQNPVASLLAANQKRVMGKAAEKEKKEQAKQEIQLSIVNEHGAFLPPPPLEKAYKEHFTDNDEDFFQTIISTSPERVRTFLSAASTISPEMFSSPSSKIKRHTLVSFPSSFSNSLSNTSNSSHHEFVDEESTICSLRSSPPRTVPSKDDDYTPKQQQQLPVKDKCDRVQVAYLTGEMEEDLNEALSESMSGSVMASFGPSSPSQESVPDLVDDDDQSGSESSSSSLSSSANASPRHSTALSFQKDSFRFQQPFAKRKALREESLDIEMPLAH
ncbi:hypothetical protein BGZ65_012291 [Modicella reniformis]|uniref:Uncharacterized protein n=1 Tax=Modicella reniformis TaxID=1440133 RepID=A0A9P6SUQ5_9FUNG|nr:hypothetical protein BGZ65_012291 [Modicella reniformis]